MATKHTEGEWGWEWKEEGEESTGWRNGRLLAKDIPNGQYNKTIICVSHYNHNDGPANAALIEACPIMYNYISQKADNGDSEAKTIISAIAKAEVATP